MKIIKISYLDPIIDKKTFMSAEDIKNKCKPRVLEAVGYYISETNDTLYIGGSSISNGKYNPVMAFPRQNIVTDTEITIETASDILEIKFEDVRIANHLTAADITTKHEPLYIQSVGFLVHQDEENTMLAMEKGRKDYRTIISVPTKFLIKN